MLKLNGNETPNLTFTYLMSAVTSIVGLLISQETIDNRTGQLVTGLAAILIPVGLAIAHSIHQGHVDAAKIRSKKP